MLQNKEQVLIKAMHIIQKVKGRKERLVDCLKSTGEIRTGKYGCTGEEVTDRVKNRRTERKNLGRKGGIEDMEEQAACSSNTMSHIPQRRSITLALLFDLLLRKVLKGPFF